MAQFLKVKGKPNLLRDKNSKAIIVYDNKALEKAKALKAKINRKDEVIEELNDKVKELEKKLDIILEKINDTN